MAAHGNRSILGPVNPYDDGARANYVDGGDDSLTARQPYRPPSQLTDQPSPQTEAERGGLETSFKESR
jgi:hypothetical protein